MANSLSGKCVIAGIGATRFGGLPGRSTISLNIEAIRKALADAGIAKDQVDALWGKCPTSKFEFMFGQKVAEAAGAQRIYGTAADGGAVLPRRLRARFRWRRRGRGDERCARQAARREKAGADPGLRPRPDLVGSGAAA